MKKFKLMAVTILICLVTAISSGCYSAYDLAVRNGYTGTEKQWLESLKGKDGSDGSDMAIEQVYLYAQKNGFEGTYLDFLNEYLSFEVSQSNEAAISKGLRSAVEVYCTFNRTSYLGGDSYTQGGSGVIYKFNKKARSAYIITNYHVVYSNKSGSGKISSDINIIPYGGEKIAATYVGGTPTFDLAILKVDDFTANDFFCAASFNTQNVAVGQTAIAIGNPSGSGISATQGIVSVDSENIIMPAIDNPISEINMRVMRIDAAVNSGNSGGGLINDNGEFIGIVNAKSGDNNIENVGYAIPASIVVSVAENILRNGTFLRGLAGITVKSDKSYAYLDENNRARIAETVIIDAVGGSANGILRKGDIIKSVKVFDTEFPVTRLFNVGDAILMASPGDEIVFNVERNGENKTLSITLS